jgi:hypothetical protein
MRVPACAISSLRPFFVAAILALGATRARPAAAQAEAPTAPAPAAQAKSDDQAGGEKKKHFFDHINVRGYTQLRFNQLLETNEKLVNVQGDRSMGGNGGFLIRRARLVLSGDIHPQVAAYLQLDAASTSGDALHFVQVRDWYFDLAADARKEFRLRVGQSKVPFGFENMQSSQNRLPLDRSDAINSALANERDLGMFFYFAPEHIRKRFKHLVDDGLKGSGDYGVVALGVFNGQTANRPELNRNKHVVARLAYPFVIGNQIVELGGGGYTGKYVVSKDSGIGGETEVTDTRVNASFVLYPQPIGLQVEYNAGLGPELVNGRFEPDDDGEETFVGEVRRRSLYGGYALLSLKLGDAILYTRGSFYEGGKKHEKNAPSYSVRELESGVEWQVIKQLELTAAYTVARRTYSSPPYQDESGRVLRLQAQVNY